MNILHVYKDYFPVLGGIENHVRLLAEAQAAHGHAVTVLVTNPGRETVEAVWSGVRVVKAGRVTPLAGDLQFAPRPSSEVAMVRQRYHLPARYGLYFGSNKPHKNLVRLLEAWSQIARDAAPVKLVLAGHWDVRFPQAQERAATLGLEDSVLFLGPIPEPDLPALYSGAEWFIFPSLYEGFGLPVLEAMACGTPVLCSNTPVLREWRTRLRCTSIRCARKPRPLPCATLWPNLTCWPICARQFSPRRLV